MRTAQHIYDVKCPFHNAQGFIYIYIYRTCNVYNTKPKQTGRRRRDRREGWNFPFPFPYAIGLEEESRKEVEWIVVVLQWLRGDGGKRKEDEGIAATAGPGGGESVLQAPKEASCHRRSHRR